MVLANGQHVKFGPSEWDVVEGYVYPQTRKVKGLCNKNVHHLEEEWEWGLVIQIGRGRQRVSAICHKARRYLPHDPALFATRSGAICHRARRYLPHHPGVKAVKADFC